MSESAFRDLVRDEQEKRRRCADPIKQWRVFLETCAWIDAQQPIPRNSKAGCLAEEKRRAEGKSG